jgi:hypothetical protein
VRQDVPYRDFSLQLMPSMNDLNSYCRLGAVVATMFTTSALTAQSNPKPTDDAAGVRFFESNIRPVLVKHCYECHSNQSGASEGGLRLDTRDAVRAGGERGPAVVPGSPEKSILLTAVRHSDPDLKMPPQKRKLPESIIADLRKIPATKPLKSWLLFGKLAAISGRIKLRQSRMFRASTVTFGRDRTSTISS